MVPVVSAPIDLKAAAVRESGGVRYLPKQPKKMGFAAAEDFCARVRVDGEDGWRMPELWELHELTRNRALRLPKGVYWSRTNAKGFGERALVWSSKKTRAAPIGRKFRGGYALCVKTP